MRKNFQGHWPHTTEQLRAELAVQNLIDQDDYVRGTFTLGADEGWREAFTNPGYNWVYPSLPLIFPSNTSL